MLGNPIIQPGIYPGPAQAGLLRPNGQQWLFQQQLVTAGLAVGGLPGLPNANPSASIAVRLGRIQDGYPVGASVTVFFTDINGKPASPGNFEMDWQNSDTDEDFAFVTVSSLVNVASLNASFCGRIELPLMFATYMRVGLKSLTNAVYANALVTR